MTPEALHSVDSSRWMTPAWLVEIARELLGGDIDLDPASDEAGNARIQAKNIYTIETDGLAHSWDASTVFVNPPSPFGPWWAKMTNSHIGDRFGVGVYVAYSIEQLQQSQLIVERGEAAKSILDYPVLIPARRIAYDRTVADAIASKGKLVEKILILRESLGPDAFEERLMKLTLEIEKLKLEDPNKLVPGDSPPHAGAVAFLGIDKQRVRRVCQHMGRVVG